MSPTGMFHEIYVAANKGRKLEPATDIILIFVNST